MSSKQNVPDYVTSDEDDDDSLFIKQTSKATTPSQSQSDNDVMIDDDDISIAWNISKIESSRDPNFDLMKVKENLSFTIGQQTSVIQSDKIDDEDEIIVLDSDGNSMLSFTDKKVVAERPNKLLANKPELSDESDLDNKFLDIVGSGISDTELSKGFSPFFLNSNSETCDSIIECDKILSQKEVKKTKKPSPNRTKMVRTVKKPSKKIKSRSFIPTDDDDSDDEIKEIEAPNDSNPRKIRRKPLLISDDLNETLPNQSTVSSEGMIRSKTFNDSLASNLNQKEKQSSQASQQSQSKSEKIKIVKSDPKLSSLTTVLLKRISEKEVKEHTKPKLKPSKPISPTNQIVNNLETNAIQSKLKNMPIKKNNSNHASKTASKVIAVATSSKLMLDESSDSEVEFDAFSNNKKKSDSGRPSICSSISSLITVETDSNYNNEKGKSPIKHLKEKNLINKTNCRPKNLILLQENSSTTKTSGLKKTTDPENINPMQSITSEKSISNNKRTVPSRGKTSIVYLPNISEPPELVVKPKSTVTPKPAAILPKLPSIQPEPAINGHLSNFKIPKLVKRDQPVRSTASNLMKKKSEEATKAVKKAIKHSINDTKKSTKQNSSKENLPKNQTRETEKPKTKTDPNKTAVALHNHATRSSVPKPNTTQQPPPPFNPIASLLNSIDTVQTVETIESVCTKENAQGPLLWAKPLSLRQLREKRLEYHKKNDCNYPMYSLAFLVDDHTKTLNKFCGGLEPKLLLSHVEKTDDPLCVSRLSESEQIELCKLMTRDSGRINRYSLFGLNAFESRSTPVNVDEMLKKYGKHAENLRKGLPLEFANDAELDQFLTTELPKLTLLESYPIYEHFIEKLTSPLRKITIKYDDELKAENIRVQFFNNRIIESTDSSLEACVKYICHKNKFDYPINTFIHENAFQVNELIGDDYVNKVIQIKKLLNDPQLFDRMKIQKIMDNIVRKYDGPVRDNEYRWNENHVDRLGYPVRDESRSNYRLEMIKDPSKANSNKYERPRFERFETHINNRESRGGMKMAKEHALIDELEYRRRIEGLPPDLNVDEIYQII